MLSFQEFFERKNEEVLEEAKKRKKKWIQKAVKHPGRCTPMGTPECPPGSPQYRLAQRFKKHEFKPKKKSSYKESVNHDDQFADLLEFAAHLGFSGKKFVEKVVQPSLTENWTNIPEFVDVLSEKMDFLVSNNEVISEAWFDWGGKRRQDIRSGLQQSLEADKAAQSVKGFYPYDPETKLGLRVKDPARVAALKQKFYGEIIKSTKENFAKIIEDLPYKAALAMDAEGSDPEARNKRYIIKDLYNKLSKTVNAYDPQFVLSSPKEKAAREEEARQAETEFMTRIMPELNRMLQADYPASKYKNFEELKRAIEARGSRGYTITGNARKGMRAKIQDIYNKATNPVYKRKLQELLNAFGPMAETTPAGEAPTPEA